MEHKLNSWFQSNIRKIETEIDSILYLNEDNSPAP